MIKMNKEEIRGIEDAAQQFTGFTQGYYYQNLIGLIISMSLEEQEWNYLKENGMISLEEKEIEEIDEYFRELLPKKSQSKQEVKK